MKYGIIFLLASVFIGGGLYWYSNDKAINPMSVTKKKETAPFSAQANLPQQVAKEDLKIINLSLDSKTPPLNVKPDLPDVSASNEITDIELDQIQSNMNNQHTEIKEKILKLDGDLLNKQARQDLSTHLKEASEYRENVLIKAKQEMSK